MRITAVDNVVHTHTHGGEHGGIIIIIERTVATDGELSYYQSL